MLQSAGRTPREVRVLGLQIARNFAAASPDGNT